ncbi:MAG TPA: ATP-binding protein, partial [Alphaproteobacteria bacterium]|nr:ATP-binding protein [Alphaproteobacteria bacterium]
EEQAHGLIEVDEESAYGFARLLKQQASSDLYQAYQSAVLSVPLVALLKPLDRQMAAVAEKLEKRVKPIRFLGEPVRVHSRPLQPLLMSLTHVVHNILDHGIEPPEQRFEKGKSTEGEVSIHMRHLSNQDGKNWIEIIIADDGAGIDPAKVREKLAETDPNGAWRQQDDRTVIQNLILRDISTRKETTLLSGRGAGLGAVAQEVARLGGRTELRSEIGKGTQMVIHLPETLA